MSQSPLSRAIRELERELGLVLFVRTTRRVELTSAGSILLERSRRALAEIDGAIAEARRSAQPDAEVAGHRSRTVQPFAGDAYRRRAAGAAARATGSHRRGRDAGASAADCGGRARGGGRAGDAGGGAPPRRSRRRAEGRAAPGRASRVAPVRERRTRFRSAPLPASRCCCHVNRRGERSTTGCGRWSGRQGSSSSGRWRRSAHRGIGACCRSQAARPSRCSSPSGCTSRLAGVVAVPFDPPLSFPLDFASSWPPTDGVEALVRDGLPVCATPRAG